MPYPSRRYKPRVPVTRKRRAAYGAYRGRGLYTGRGGFFDSAVKGVRSAIGAYRKYVPEKQRQMLGIAAQNFKDAGIAAARDYAGMGSYNELVRGKRYVTPEAIVMRSKGDETSSVCVTNKEYIGDIFGPDSQQFTNTSFALNPALNAVFPWLSQIAANYDEYEFEQLIFEYHPTISETSTATSGQSGTAILVTNYNPSQAAFSDKESMMQYHGGQSDRVTAMSIHGVECDPRKSSQGRRYTRTSPVIVGQDSKNFDLGLFQLAINNIPSSYFNQQLGELWVHYKVHLHVPKLGSGRGNSINQDFFLTNNLSLRDQVFDTNYMLYGQQNTIGCQVRQSAITGAGTPTAVVTMQIVFPAFTTGDYDIQIRWTSGTLGEVFLANPATANSNMTFVADEYPLSNLTQGNNYFLTTGTDCVNWFQNWHVNVKSATGGFDNYFEVQFQMEDKANIPEEPLWGQVAIYITERNATAAQSASSAQIVWLDATGNAQVPVHPLNL